MKKFLSVMAVLTFLGSAQAGMLDEINYRYGDSTNTPGIMIGRARGQSASPEHLYTSDILNGIYGYGYDGTNFNTTSRSSIEIQASETWTSTANGTKILFKTTPVTTLTPATMLTISGTGVTVAGTIAASTTTFSGLVTITSNAAPRTNVATTAIGNLIVNTGSTPNEMCFSTGTSGFSWVKVSTPTAACSN